MTVNFNPTTGIRYGVIACASLDDDVVEELFYGGGATDLSYSEAFTQLGNEVAAEADAIEEECCIAVKERDGNLTERDREDLIEREIDNTYERKGYKDRDDFIETEVDRRRDHSACEEPRIDGKHEGVKYEIHWLGGAPLLYVIEGPRGFADRLCSPCAPNAADLDGGFRLESEMLPHERANIWFDGKPAHPCYCVPRDWLRVEA